MRLILAEKPSVARVLADSLLGPKKQGTGFIQCGDEVTVTWSFGHIFEQEDPDAYTDDTVPRNRNGRKKWRMQDLPVFPDTWKKVPKPSAKKQISVIAALLSRSSEVIQAADPDREGQLLGDEILEMLGWTGPTYRLWLSALDKRSIEKAWATLRDNRAYRNLRDSAEARSRADWLMGMNFTRACTLRNQGSGVLSVGRVQTPTLALVVARDEEIANFHPQDYFVTQIFAGFWATWEPQSGDPVDAKGRLFDRDFAQALLEKASLEGHSLVQSVQKNIEERDPPLGFSLSTLQMTCSRDLGMTAQQVLEIAQALYEKHQAITYPRTDCRYLPEEQFDDAPMVLSELASIGYRDLVAPADAQRRSKIWNTEEVSSHHAIIPTGSLEGPLSEPERQVFDLIVRCYLSQFYPPLRWEATNVSISCAQALWNATSKTILDPGWTSLYQPPKDDSPFPAMTMGESLPVTETRLLEKQTKAPPRYTDGLLLRSMRDVHLLVSDPDAKEQLQNSEGLGTEATRAAVIETLLKREFLRREGIHLFSTDAGKSLIEALPDELKDPVLTAKWEKNLSAIAQGHVGMETFEEAQKDFVRNLFDTVSRLSFHLGEKRQNAQPDPSPESEECQPFGLQAVDSAPAKVDPLQEVEPICPRCGNHTANRMMPDRTRYFACDHCHTSWWPNPQYPGELGFPL